jgi:hypothetical protein
MPESTEKMLFDLLKRQGDQSTIERRELRESFEANLRSIRNEFRVFALIVVLGLLALLGVGANVHIPGLSIQTTTGAADAPTMTVTTVDPERAADAVAPVEDPTSDAEHAPLAPLEP